MEKVLQIPSQCETGTVWLEISLTETLLDYMDWEGEVREVKSLSNIVKEMDLNQHTVEEA